MGIDIDFEAINYAKVNMESKYQNTRFFTLEEFLKTGITMKADVVICFEVFEHVEDTNWLLSSLVSLTKDNGLIFLSTPNGLSSKGDRTLYRSKFHIREYTPLDFYNLLRKYGTVQLFGERRWDKLDVEALLLRAKKERAGPLNDVVPLGNPILFNLVTRHFNNKVFWKIYSIDPNSETELTFSTTIALLRPYRS